MAAFGAAPSYGVPSSMGPPGKAMMAPGARGGPLLAATGVGSVLAPPAAAPVAAPPPSAAKRVPTHGYAAEQNGRFRSYMEDDHVVAEAYCGREDCLFAAVYDGHGGRLAVDFAVAHLHSALAAELRASRHGDPLGCLSRAFVRTDRMLVQAGAYHCGSTAGVVLFERDPHGRPALHAANVGDTRVVVYGGSGRDPLCLSVDHLPGTNAAEVERIQRAGGRVMNNRVGGSLAVSRALGDHALKGEGGGVSAEPHTASRVLTADDRFVLLASDGVWDVLTVQQAHELVLQGADAEGLPMADVAMRVVQAALKGGSRDNISCLILDVRGIA